MGHSFALGSVALPLGALIRLIPNGPCERIFVILQLLSKPDGFKCRRFEETQRNYTGSQYPGPTLYNSFYSRTLSRTRVFPSDSGAIATRLTSETLREGATGEVRL